MLGDIDRNLKPTEYRLYLCKPNKDTIAELKEANDIVITTKLNALHELSFEIPYKIEKNRQFVDNAHVDMLRGHYLIRVNRVDSNGNVLEKEYFVISKPSSSAQDGKETKRIQCYQLPYKLRGVLLKAYSGTKTLREVLLETLVVKTNWNIGTIDYHIENVYRTFDEGLTNMLDFVYKLAETFDVVVVWNTETMTVSFYKSETLGEDKGLSIEYGKYLKSINEDENFDNVVTRLYCYGNEDMSIERMNLTGQPYLEDLSFYLYPFKQDENGNIIKHSNYMSDDLCIAQLAYQEFLASKEPIECKAETGTNETNIKITNHGLQVGDYIENTDKDAIRKVITVVDSNNFTVDSVPNQIPTDTILLYKEGTFGKLFYKKEDLQQLLTQKENQMSDLVMDLAIILDNLDVANASGQSTTELNNQKIIKEAEIEAKQSEIDSINSQIADVDSALQRLRAEVAIENHFTPELIAERNEFIIESTWTDTNYTNDEDLYRDGKKHLKRLSQPLISYEIDIIDFLQVVSCQRDWDKLVIGDIVSIKYPNLGIDIKAKIIEIVNNVRSNTISLKIANAKDLQDGFLALEDLISNAVSTSTTLNLSKPKWDKAEQSAIETIINNIWDATRAEIQAGINESVDISRRGIIIKDPNDSNKYIVMQHGVIALASVDENGVVTWKTAIRPDGIVAETIRGKLGQFVEIDADCIIAGKPASEIAEGGIDTGQIESIVDGAINEHDSDESPHNLPSYCRMEPDGFKVYDALDVLRCHLGQYISGEYGLKVVNGEIYGTKIRSGQEGTTSYIELSSGFDPLSVVVNTKKVLEVYYWEDGGVIEFSGMDGKYKGSVGTDSSGLYLESYPGLINVSSSRVQIEGSEPGTYVYGDFRVSRGTKNAVVRTENYGYRNLSARESPESRFIEEGFGNLVNGECIVYLDPVYLETIEPNTPESQWYIHITEYGDFDCYVSEVADTYFIVKEKQNGTSNGSFSWSLSAVRMGYKGKRLEQEPTDDEALHSNWEDTILEGVVE